MKKILITSGSTSMKIDTVRTISNIFKGTTGALIANKAAEKDDRLPARHGSGTVFP